MRTRTISDLRNKLRGSIYVYLKDEKTCRQFYEDAQEEGFCFGSILPTQSPSDDIIAVDEGKQLGHVGFTGHMRFHNSKTSEDFHRIDYAKYASGYKNFYYAGDSAAVGELLPEYIDAHVGCSENEDIIKNSTTCGCFYCKSIFRAEEVTDWTDDFLDKLTALCPVCGIDSVIGDASGFAITKDLLEKMEKYWF